jgi:DNA-directed RNA polymerase subunit RPC12/RpoP
MRRYNKGWTQESERHSLAARRVRTGRRVHSAKWDRCVEAVKAHDGKYNPYAMCTARLGEKSFLKAGGDVNKLSYKKYQCQRCGHVMDIQTNHWGEVYPRCPNCSWKHPLDQQSTFKVIEPVPEGAWIPEPWKKVRLGDVADIVVVKNKKKSLTAKGSGNMSLARAKWIEQNIGRHHGERFITDEEYEEALRVLQKDFEVKNKKKSLRAKGMKTKRKKRKNKDDDGSDSVVMNTGWLVPTLWR